MIPAPLFRDPIYDGPADPMIIRKASDGKFYMFYTQRRASQQVCDVSYCYGTSIGVAESVDGSYWLYRGALDLDFEFGHNTFWAPEVVYDEENELYHMYVSYIRGVHCNWGGTATIEHYTSRDLFYWDHRGKLEVASTRIIDPAIAKTPEGIWLKWYKDEDQRAVTCYADSKANGSNQASFMDVFFHEIAKERGAHTKEKDSERERPTKRAGGNACRFEHALNMRTEKRPTIYHTNTTMQ